MRFISISRYTCNICCAYAGENLTVVNEELKNEADINNYSGQYLHTLSDKQFTRNYSLIRRRHLHCKKEKLTSHKKIHTEEKCYACNQCEKSFLSQWWLRWHMSIHTSIFKCTECGRCCRSSHHLAVHMRSHSGDRPFECTVCSKRFTLLCTLVRHSKTHRDNSYKCLYKCSQCEKRFLSQQSLQHHMNIHTSKFKCTQCGKCCESGHRQALHMQSHSGDRPFECTVCSKRFTLLCTLVRHSKIHGDNSYKCSYKCSQCEKHFLSQDSFQLHMNIHTCKCKCTECGKFCRSSYHLAIHMRSHSGDKSLECTVCSKRFMQLSNFVVHRKTHEEKPYKCYVCGLAFMKVLHLKLHMKTHTRAELYTCSLCNLSFSGFSHSFTLQLHERDVHNSVLHTDRNNKDLPVIHRNTSGTMILKNVEHIPAVRPLTGAVIAVKSQNEANSERIRPKPPLQSQVIRLKSSTASAILHQTSCSSNTTSGIRKNPAEQTISGAGPTTSRDLVVDSRRETGEKLYKCYVCDEAFSEAADLISHAGVHTLDESLKNTAAGTTVINIKVVPAARTGIRANMTTVSQDQVPTYSVGSKAKFFRCR